MSISRIAKISILTAILCVLSQISIQVGAVPITLQNLGVFLAGFILGPVDGMLSILIYLILGAFGIPVFSGGSSGLKILLGPTGGYLLSFPLAAFVCGYFSYKFNTRLSIYLSGMLSILVIYTVGVPYLSLITGMPLSKALIIGVYPFILPDILKMFLSAYLGQTIKARLIKENLITSSK